MTTVVPLGCRINGRRRAQLFNAGVTLRRPGLAVYMIGSGLTALTAGSSTAWIVYLYGTRFIAGTGVGAEYAAINSAIDELIPPRCGDPDDRLLRDLLLRLRRRQRRLPDGQ
jgi:MFS family permease